MAFPGPRQGGPYVRGWQPNNQPNQGFMTGPRGGPNNGPNFNPSPQFNSGPGGGYRNMGPRGPNMEGPQMNCGPPMGNQGMHGQNNMRGGPPPQRPNMDGPPMNHGMYPGPPQGNQQRPPFQGCGMGPGPGNRGQNPHQQGNQMGGMESWGPCSERPMMNQSMGCDGSNSNRGPPNQGNMGMDMPPRGPSMDPGCMNQPRSSGPPCGGSSFQGNMNNPNGPPGPGQPGPFMNQQTGMRGPMNNQGMPCQGNMNNSARPCGPNNQGPGMNPPNRDCPPNGQRPPFQGNRGCDIGPGGQNIGGPNFNQNGQGRMPFQPQNMPHQGGPGGPNQGGPRGPHNAGPGAPHQGGPSGPHPGPRGPYQGPDGPHQGGPGGPQCQPYQGGSGDFQQQGPGGPQPQPGGPQLGPGGPQHGPGGPQHGPPGPQHRPQGPPYRPNGPKPGPPGPQCHSQRPQHGFGQDPQLDMDRGRPQGGCSPGFPFREGAPPSDPDNRFQRRRCSSPDYRAHGNSRNPSPGPREDLDRPHNLDYRKTDTDRGPQTEYQRRSDSASRSSIDRHYDQGGSRDRLTDRSNDRPRRNRSPEVKRDRSSNSRESRGRQSDRDSTGNRRLDKDSSPRRESRDRSPRRIPPSRDRHKDSSRDRSSKPRNSDKGRRSRSPSETGRNARKRRRSPEKKGEKGKTSSRRHSRSRSPSPPPSFAHEEDFSRYSEEVDKLLAEMREGCQSKNLKRSSAEKMEGEPSGWIRCSPADLYFKLDRKTGQSHTTQKMKALEEKFEDELVKRAEQVRAGKPKYEPPERLHPRHLCMHSHNHDDSSSCCSSSSSEDEEEGELEASNQWLSELNRKRRHPERLHEDLWFNEKGEMNDGPLCRCSRKSRRTGIRHDIFPGEHDIEKCTSASNNADKLYHYRITMSPHTNFLTKNPTAIEHDNHEYIFEGFSLFSHAKLENVPVCNVIRFNIEYTIHWFEEDMPENFSVHSLRLFTTYLFRELLELLDLDWEEEKEQSCNQFHLMPRFARILPDNGKEILSMNEVLQYLLDANKPLLEEMELSQLVKQEQHEWLDMVDDVRGMLVTNPGSRPSSIRVDQLDREQNKTDVINYPLIIHFGIRPAQLSYVGDANYLRLWKQYVKFKHLLANKPKVSAEDRHKLLSKEDQLLEMRLRSNMKREVTVEISSEGFLQTGIKSDICQHALLLPVLIQHLRFHRCLDMLEKKIHYQFQDRTLLQYALTHPSYRVNYGTNPDHARNSVSNCGVRQPEYGDRSIHYTRTRKRGINVLISIMAKMGKKVETTSNINHYERLEFLGDAVVEFLTSIHLYFMFPRLEEGGLATYRAALVQNQHLSVLAETLKLQDYMLYAHGPDLCHEIELKHAMANCFEALLGALLLDGGIEIADRVLAETLFDNGTLQGVWTDLAPHPLQEEEPRGDRHWIKSSPVLQKLTQFEGMIGVEFNHIRLLARAFSLRNMWDNTLTHGHNQRLEFLGDTVLQLICSEYLYKHFPDHHEGHLSLLRSSLVSNKMQSVICEDLGMTQYVIQDPSKATRLSAMRLKDKADLLEAFLGALYVDKGLEYCKIFCYVCFFPRLRDFIMNQDWNDPKSRLQQCCLTLRELDSSEPDTPMYRVLEASGPTNMRQYKVAVYFREKRLAVGYGASIQSAQMEAADNALRQKSYLFPQLHYQKNYIEKKYKQDKEADKERKKSSSSGRKSQSTRKKTN